MKNIYVTIFATVISISSFSQSNIWGRYICTYESYIKLDLKPDSTYKYYNYNLCGSVPPFIDSGAYITQVDTIVLHSSNLISYGMKFLYHSNDIVLNNSVTCDSGSLSIIIDSDSILDANSPFRLTEYESLEPGPFYKYIGYFSNGNIEYTLIQDKKKQILMRSFTSGGLKSIETYSKNMKVGRWYFYNEDGTPDRIEKYRRGKYKGLKKIRSSQK